MGHQSAISSDGMMTTTIEGLKWAGRAALSILYQLGDDGYDGSHGGDRSDTLDNGE